MKTFLLTFSAAFLTLAFSLKATGQVPTITTFSPDSGLIGTTVTITGTNFSHIAENNIVYFGAVKATVTAASATSLTVIVPAGATYQPLSVTVNSLTAYSNTPFIVTFPCGNPTLSFVRTNFIPRGVPQAIADIDGDGKGDFVFGKAPDSVSIFRNLSVGEALAFAPEVNFPTGTPNYVTTGDLDGDGKLDLAVVNIASKTISLLRNTSSIGNISFVPKVDLPITGSPKNVAIGDLNGDGKPDLAIQNPSPDPRVGPVSVFLNVSTIGTLAFASKVDFPTQGTASYAFIADFDVDGKPDLAVLDEAFFSVSVLRNTSIGGSLSFTEGDRYPAGFAPRNLAIQDLDRDGKPDLVTIGSNSGLAVVRNTSAPGTISFASSQFYSTNIYPGSPVIGDLNGDGKPEVVVPSLTNDNTREDIYGFDIYENTSIAGSLSLAYSKRVSTLGDVTSSAIVDLNGDGKADLLIQNDLYRNETVCSPCAPADRPTFKNDGTIALNPTCGNSDGALYIVPTSGTAPFMYSKDGGTSYVSGSNAGYTFNNLAVGTYKLRLKDARGCESAIIEKILASSNCPPTICNDPTFNPTDQGFGFGDGANNEIMTTAIQSDGKIIIGGMFTSYNGTARNNIARLNSDGSLDAGFNPGTGANVTTAIIYTTSVQSNGKIVIGGFFYNGTARNTIARLNTDGSFDAGFNPSTGANFEIRTTAIQSDGKIIIGGYFTSYNGTARNYIARLNIDGSLDASFNPGTGANSYIRTIAIQSDGKIIIGGDFTSYNGTARNGIARLNTNGSLDAGFNPGTGANGTIYTTSLQSDGKIIIAGFFTSYNGTARNGIARLNTNGSLDAGFNPGTGANGTIYTTSLQSDGKIIISGNFTSYNETARNRIARLNIDGSMDAGFNPGTGANGAILTTAIQSDGKIIIGGGFTSYNGTARNYIARLNTDGTLDAGFNPGTGANGVIRTTAIQSDGKIIIGGDFTSYNGMARNRIGRLNTDGTLDAGFNPGTGANNVIRTIAIESDGKIIIGGGFSTYNGTASNAIARLNIDGSLDAGFNPGIGANGTIYTTSIQSDGKIIIGGLFTSYNGTAKNRIARLNTDGSLDAGFNTGTGVNFDILNNAIYTTAIQSDGKIIIGGAFTSYNETARNRIARLNIDGSMDAGFNPGIGANSTIFTTAIQSDGKIIIGGEFTSYDGTGINRFARLNTDGTLDARFNPGTGANSTIYTTAIQSDGKIIIGGAFTSFNGTGRNRIARVMDCAVSCTPPTFINDGTIVRNPDCGESNGAIYLIPLTGVAPFQYSIDGGITYHAGPDAGYSFEELAAGTYQLRIKDAGGCESEVARRILWSANCPVTNLPPPSATCTALPAFINDGTIVRHPGCGKSDGVLYLIPTSGTGPFLYSIDGGKTYYLGPENGYSFKGLSAGMYQLRIRDANGCESSVVKFMLWSLNCPVTSLPPTPDNCTPPTFLNNGQIIRNPTCGNNDGAIWIIPTSSTGPFLYSINGGKTYFSGPSEGYGFENLSAGFYQLRIMDANGCQSTVAEREIASACAVPASKPVVDNQAEVADKKTVMAYPNPSQGRFKVRLQEFASEKLQVYVFDIKGAIVEHQNVIGNNILNFDLRERARGLYFIRVVSSKRTAVVKVLIQ